MSRIGVAIGVGHVRAVRVNGVFASKANRVTLAEATYTSDRDATISFREAVAALRDRLGTASRVGVAVDMPLLFAKHIKLPPVRAAEKRRMIALEPERFFPVRGEELVIAAHDGSDNLVFATREEQLSEWLSALEQLGAVDHVEPAPAALARAFVKSGVRDGAIPLNGGGDRVALIELRAGRVAGVRRVSKDDAAYLAALHANGAGHARAPVSDAYLAAFGASLGIGSDLGEALISQPAQQRIARRRRRDVVLSALAFATALVLALLSIDRVHARQARIVERDVAGLRDRAEAVLAMQTELNALDQRAAAVAKIQATRPDPVRVLHALTERLPRTTYLRMIRASGAEWQISGYAPDASSLVPLLERAPEFEGVRFLSAIANERVANRNYESFSLAFRIAAAP